MSTMSSLRAVLLREVHAALINRYLQVFAALSLLGGMTAFFFSESGNAVEFFLVQIALFLISLWAVLAGVSSAQADREEWPLMLAQPVPRSVYVIGKFLAYLAIFAVVLLMLFLPAIFAGARTGDVTFLYGHTLLLAATFLALGFAAGFFAHDRAQGLIIAVGSWLVLLFGIDLLGLFAARIPLVQKIPDLWVSTLMANPLDAFRIHALFTLEQIPAETANRTPMAAWWITHAAVWFCFIAVLWTLGLNALSSWKLNRIEE